MTARLTAVADGEEDRMTTLHGVAAGPRDAGSRRPPPAATAALTLGALGVVFGDIGTSPLYALREVFVGAHPLAPDTARMLGVLSLMTWSLMIVVTIKFALFIMRADNDGEGGIMALVALVKRDGGSRWFTPLVLLGIFGAALFYGDGVITPAISVLSAVEGLTIVAPGVESAVVPAAIAILVLLFAIQRRGTGAVGALFGPVMVVWFTTLGVLGALEIARHPGILRALSPSYAVAFFVREPGLAFLSLGSVVLAVTGAEALYADMGHFGRPAITRAWALVTLPALLLNYFGQGALVLAHPATVENPFYLLAPSALRLPLVILATVATVVASQAVISGAFSMTRQAVQLGFLPRVVVRHTSGEHEGQIYVPVVNWLLCISVAALVAAFGSSSGLASAYGVAVTATLAIDTVLALVVVRRLWHRPLWAVVAGGSALLIVDLAFFSAQIPKIPEGGWFPLLGGLAVFTLLSTWWRGRKLALDALSRRKRPLAGFLDSLETSPPTRVPGTAVYLATIATGIPAALTRNVEHNRVLHEHVILMTCRTVPAPRVADADRLQIRDLGHGLFRVVAAFGFMEDPDVPHAVRLAAAAGVPVTGEVTYMLSHITLRPTRGGGMAYWRKHLFAAMSRNSLRASTHLGVPTRDAMELGTQVDI
ncbi:MAG: potassium transporter Kup [Thermoleophilia bacterium]